ncbi:hypothetical protein Trydic_g6127 [Trypoxylus dichotomus]
MEREEPQKKYEDVEMQLLLDEDDSQTQKQLAKKLGFSQQAISNRLRKMGKIQKTDRWIPHGLNDLFSKCQAQKIDPGALFTSTAKANRFGRKITLCVCCDQRAVVYYELLKPGETVNIKRY